MDPQKYARDLSKALLRYSGDDQYEDEATPEPPPPPPEPPTEPPTFDGRIAAGVFKKYKTRGPQAGVIDKTGLGALGDHLQELDNPLGELLTRHATGESGAKFVRLSGQVLHHLWSHDGDYQLISREGNDKEGKPLVWVSLSQWKKVPLDNGHTRKDIVKSYEFTLHPEPRPKTRR